MLLVGTYAQRWALRDTADRTLTETVRAGPRPIAQFGGMCAIPLPHPSWRNTGWLKANPWFASDILPRLRHAVGERL
jgi:uracil-DNA glycosylase